MVVLLEKQPIPIARKRAALDQLQASLKPDDAKVEQWIQTAREEREPLVTPACPAVEASCDSPLKRRQEVHGTGEGQPVHKPDAPPSILLSLLFT